MTDIWDEDFKPLKIKDGTMFNHRIALTREDLEKRRNKIVSSKLP